MHCQSQEESQVGGKTAAISRPMYVIPGISALVGKCFHIQAASSWTHKHFALLDLFSLEIIYIELEYLCKSFPSHAQQHLQKIVRDAIFQTWPSSS